MTNLRAVPTVSPDESLTARGVLLAAQKAHWQPQANAWKYPIHDLSGSVLSYRYKAFNSNAKPKYWWDGPACTYYLLPGLREAIQQYHGLLYIASGEPDVLTFKSAGIDNVLCWFGETSVPPDLAAFLHELGVSHVVNYPDRDHTGHKAAEKIAAALHDTDIQFHAAALPDYFGDKGDINLLWQHVKFDRDAFLAALANDTQPLEFEPPNPKPQKRKPIYQDDNQQGYYAAIEQALDIGEYKGNGWSKKAITCPIFAHEHDDTQPAARWHRDKHILHCFKCGETYLAKQVGAALGIEWKDFAAAALPPSLRTGTSRGDFTAAPDSLPRPTLDILPAVTDDLYHFPQGIPDTLREALLNLHQETSIKDHAPALIVLELRQHPIEEQHLAPDESLTANWLIDYAEQIDWHTSTGVIRRGLQQLVALGFLEISQLQPEGRGRPTDLYHPQPLPDALPRLQEALRYRSRERIFSDHTPDTITPEWFDDLLPEVARELAQLENERRQSLYEEYAEARQQAERQYEREIEKIQGAMILERLLLAQSSALVTNLPCLNSRDYRALFYRSRVADAGENGRTIARARAATQLGVSNKTLSVLRAKAGIVADEQFETMQIIDPEQVLEQVNAQFPWAAKRDFGKFLDNGSGGKKGLYNKPEDLDDWVKDELARGHTVTAYIQTASRERLATEEEQRDKLRSYEDKRQALRRQRQSRPPSPSDKLPTLLEELLAQAIEEACPPTFSAVYTLRQIAMTPYRNDAELLAYLDLFSNLRPLKEAYISRGGKYENKSDTRILSPPGQSAGSG